MMDYLFLQCGIIKKNSDENKNKNKSDRKLYKIDQGKHLDTAEVKI